MIEEKTVFVTDRDNKHFDTALEAEDHDRYLDFQEALQEMWYHNIDYNTVAKDLWENFDIRKK